MPLTGRELSATAGRLFEGVKLINSCSLKPGMLTGAWSPMIYIY